MMKKKGNLCKLPIGIFLFGLGISSLIYTPMEFLYDLRLRMIPGTPPFEYWRNPPENILLKAYLFNITNSEQFLNGSDTELHLQEIGPFVFREKLIHSNIVFNENSTLSYTVTRRPVYLPERNTFDINATFFAPNLAKLTMASYFQDSPFFIKASLNMLFNRYKSSAIVETTVYNYLLNMTDPVMDAAKVIGGGKLVPTTNVATLAQLYRNNQHNVTVFIGPKYGHNDYFNINNFDGEEWIPGNKKCLTRFINTSETTLFPQFMPKDKVIWGWKHALCKFVEARFTNETSLYGMTGYRFDIPFTLFDRTEPSYMDCFGSNPILPNGVSDLSPCYNGFPFVVSFPHFVGADPIVTKRLKGLNPNKEKHGSFLLMEKNSGVPMTGRAIFQVNLRTQNLRSFNDQIRRFSNMFIPMSYVSYEVEGLPWYIVALMYFLAIIIPNTQLIMSISFFVGGGTLFYYLYLDFRKRVDNKRILANMEGEKFLK